MLADLVVPDGSGPLVLQTRLAIPDDFSLLVVLGTCRFPGMQAELYPRKRSTEGTGENSLCLGLPGGARRQLTGVGVVSHLVVSDGFRPMELQVEEWNTRQSTEGAG